MKHFISFPKIGQFAQLIGEIKRKAYYYGQDENDEPIIKIIDLPKFLLKGTVKIHGTNAGISYNETDGIWHQSRTRIITQEKDNYGFAAFCNKRDSVFKELFFDIIKTNNIDPTKTTVTIYGEWCGENIQKGVAVSGLSKMFVIFAIKASEIDNKENSWIDYKNLSDSENNIYNIDEFGTYEIELDIENPQFAQNTIVDIVNSIEEECPVGKHFGRNKETDNTTGEGIVWTTEYEGVRYLCKTKGKKHSALNVKTIAAVDLEKIKQINEFIDYAVTENRLQQGLEQVFTSQEKPLSNKGIGDFIRWIITDIMEEEKEVIKNSGLELRYLNKCVSARASKWILNKIQNNF